MIIIEQSVIYSSKIYEVIYHFLKWSKVSQNSLKNILFLDNLNSLYSTHPVSLYSLFLWILTFNFPANLFQIIFPQKTNLDIIFYVKIQQF